MTIKYISGHPLMVHIMLLPPYTIYIAHNFIHILCTLEILVRYIHKSTGLANDNINYYFFHLFFIMKNIVFLA